MGLRTRGKKKQTEGAGWDSLPWKTIDTSDQDGLMSSSVGDAMFFGLEELDGSLFSSSIRTGASNVSPVVAGRMLLQDTAASTKEKKRKWDNPEDQKKEESENISRKQQTDNKSKKKKQEKNAGQTKALLQPNSNVVKSPTLSFDFSKNENSKWGDITLHSAIVESLGHMNFETPTRIQSISMPGALSGSCDIVGSSETGSGKTLAFGLPIIHTLLHEWEEYGSYKCPFALILAPTRELAMQISSVLTDTCQFFKSSERRIEVVNVVGGMSEHKQKRQLDGTKGARPVHIMVATPGRLCEMMTNSGEDMAAFANLSSIRFLVVDEADRMVEEGHFPELYRIFSRIRDHEKMAQKGINPIEALQQARRGVDEEAEEPISKGRDGDEQSGSAFDDGLGLMMVPPEFGGEVKAPAIKKRSGKKKDVDIEGSIPLRRQTLLFSATLLGAMAASETKRKGGKAEKIEAKLKSINSYETTCGKTSVKKYLPTFLVQLLDAVSVQNVIRIYDASSARLAAESRQSAEVGIAAPAENNIESSTAKDEDDAIAIMNKSSVAESLLLLPRTLQQFEIRAPMEEKDAMAYYFLSAVIIFFNPTLLLC